MSNLERSPGLRRCGGLAEVAVRPAHDVYAGRQVQLGEAQTVRRLLPNLGRRLVGPWCFVDHYGPEDVVDAPGMQVPPHPHIGLQTVSWLVAGQVHHRDSLGSDQVVRPGQLGLMTAGAAITHAEQSPLAHPALLHGAQLWLALPDAVRHVAPAWEYHADLPTLGEPGASATVLAGQVAGVVSPATTYSPALGVDLALDPDGRVTLPLEPGFEHALLVLSGSVTVDDDVLAPGAMVYLGCARSELALTSTDGARALLLGGAPFEEEIVMWWNFVARSSDEIVEARAAWTDGRRFGDVAGYDGYRLPAPALPPGRLKPGGSAR